MFHSSLPLIKQSAILGKSTNHKIKKSNHWKQYHITSIIIHLYNFANAWNSKLALKHLSITVFIKLMPYLYSLRDIIIISLENIRYENSPERRPGLIEGLEHVSHDLARMETHYATNCNALKVCNVYFYTICTNCAGLIKLIYSWN